MQQRRIVAIVAVVVVVIGLFFIFRSSSRLAPRATPTPTPTPKAVTLLDYIDDDDASLRLTTLGPIVAKEHHIDQIISITRGRRSINITRAYTGTSEAGKEYDNNAPAFEEFVRALDHSGFTATKAPRAANSKAPKPSDTEVGLCPSGSRYVYELIVGGAVVSRAWSTTCGDATTFGGVPSTINALFQSQIPDIRTISASVRP